MKKTLHPDAPAYHAGIEKNLSAWIAANGYIAPGLTIEELASSLATNRTYLSAYIKSTYHVSFREWIADLRIKYAKEMLVRNPEMTVSAVSKASGFLSLSYFTKIFTKRKDARLQNGGKKDFNNKTIPRNCFCCNNNFCCIGKTCLLLY